MSAAPMDEGSLRVLTPVVAVHLSAMLGALVVGPVALAMRKGTRGHRAFGYAWVTLMLAAALSAMCIRDHRHPNLWGYTPIHLLVPFTLSMIALGLWQMSRGRIQAHRNTMWGAYVGSCLVAGAFTLLPGRYLGQLVWHQWLGLL